MSYSGGSIVYICSDSISPVDRNESTENCLVADENGVKESASDKQNLLSKSEATPTVLTEISSNEGLKNYCFGGISISSNPYIVKPYISNDVSVALSTCIRIEFGENPSDLDKKTEKKNPKNKKHTNQVLSMTDKAFQKRRRRKLRLFNTEESFHDKMPYVCFECYKKFGYYSSLDEHENSHALNKVWYE